ncbi:DNA/RNA non-specific endonuclease [Mycobacterium hubeiense]|uniref:DNA/RNA non-specific endonuclease n=1 Tax=Mycobacterium hubeiense TaxID=1867256 RepID=UPI000C7EB2B6|nr:DNA/RNA non-specific endonuclease [Mycobacterium sp. QGD 101]
MTVITPASDALNGDRDPRRDALLRHRLLEERQREATRRRVAERTEPRIHYEQALASPCGLLQANTPERIAQRLDRITRYEAGDELPETTPTEPPEQLLAKAVERAPVPNSTPPEQLLEAIINTADFVGTRYLDSGVASARAVGRILIKDGRGRLIGYGTGSMISPQLMLTNHHVLDAAETAATSQVEFDYQDGIDGKLLDVTTFGFDPDRFFLADEALDFAIVAVRASGSELAPFGFNRLIESDGKALVGEFVTIVQHPRGEKKQVALRDNRIIDGPAGFVHYCADTEPGSSGSPVFNDQWEVIALHHASVRAPERTEFGGVLNEGIRVSSILGMVKSAELTTEQRALADAILHPPAPERKPSTATPLASPGEPISIKIPLTLDVTLPPGAVASVSVSAPSAPSAPASIDPDYTNRRGYDPAFLGISLPLPSGGAAAAAPLAYHHFSVVMHRQRRLALYTAVNIDGAKASHPRRDRDVWILDSRLPAEAQTGEHVYRDNDLDRGHLVRRLDPAWGPVAEAAVDDTFHFTNCTPQHHDFNAGSTLWLGLEDYVLRNAVTSDLQVSVLSGPVLDDGDPHYRGVALPLQYWKIVAMVRTDGAPSVTGYLLSQAALLDEFRTPRTPGTLPESFSYGAYRTFQVPVRRIADLTGLQLDAFIANDPLERLETTGLPRELIQLDHIVL